MRTFSGENPRIVRFFRDWLNTNRDPAAPPLPGAAAIDSDHEVYLLIAPQFIKNPRPDPHDELPHTDYPHVVKEALPSIEAGR